MYRRPPQTPEQDAGYPAHLIDHVSEEQHQQPQREARQPGEVKRALLELILTYEEAAHAWICGRYREAERLCMSAGRMEADLERFAQAWLEHTSLKPLPEASRKRMAHLASRKLMRQLQTSAIERVETPGRREFELGPRTPEEAWQLFLKLEARAVTETRLPDGEDAAVHAPRSRESSRPTASPPRKAAR